MKPKPLCDVRMARRTEEHLFDNCGGWLSGVGKTHGLVIWMQRFEETGRVAAKPSGGSTSPLEQHAEFLLGLIAAGPDAGRDRRGDAQTPDRRQPQRGVAVLRSPQHQLQKKLCTRRSRSVRT